MTVVLAVVGFIVGLAIHSVLAAAIVAVAILILGMIANEVWGIEVHYHHEHLPHV